MCAMARGLMARTAFADDRRNEPRFGAVVVEQLMEVLTAIRRDGVTVSLVEQDVYLALESADRGYVIEMGAIVRSGEAKALIEDPAVREAYLGL